MKVKIEGLRELDIAIHKYKKKLAEAFQQASADAADTFLKNTDVFVKEETGALRASGVWMQEDAGFKTETIFGYGATPEFPHYRVFVSGSVVLQEPELYAVRQHDEIESALTPGTQWHWMEHGLSMFEPMIQYIIVTEMSRV